MSYLECFPFREVVCLCIAESIKWFTKDQAFWRLYYSAHSPTHFPSHFSKLSLFSVFLCVAGRAYWREEGGGWARSQIKLPRESLALYKLFNTLWVLFLFRGRNVYVCWSLTCSIIRIIWWLQRRLASALTSTFLYAFTALVSLNDTEHERLRKTTKKQMFSI
jgi:hypothetical protein